VNVSHTDDGPFSKYSTRVINGRKQALADAFSRRLTAKHTLYCITGEELVKSYKPFVPLLRTSLQQHGGSSKIITNIEKGTIQAVNQLIEAGAEIRHIEKHMLRRCVIYDNSIAYFSIVEQPVITDEAIENVQQTEGQDLWISSTELAVIKSARERFLSDWESAIPPVDRITELEKGKPIEITRVIKDNNEAVEIYKSLIDTANSQILYWLPSARALIRIKSAGILHSLIDAAVVRNVKVSVLCPIDSENQEIIEQIRKVQNIELSAYESTTSTLLISDREHVFTTELRKNTTYNILEALSLSTYSNSKPTVQSYITLFESLWKQKQLYNELEESHNQLELQQQELQKTHGALRKSERAKEEFISMVSHELKTPIVPMKLYCQMFMKKSLGSGLNEKQKKAIQIIDRNLERLEMLVTDILDCYKLDLGRINLFREDANIDTIIRNTTTDLKSIIEDQQIFLKLDVRTTGTIFCDQRRIEQVLSNLLKNSFDFVPKNNGKITIRVEDYMDSESKKTSQKEAFSRFVMFTVDDNGPGITKSEIDKLFKKFYQIDTSFRRKHGGTGLGLAISRGLVEAHGGKIWYDKNYNAGASFKFTVPRNR
jgi:signal transduction histidine kinase